MVEQVKLKSKIKHTIPEVQDHPGGRLD